MHKVLIVAEHADGKLDQSTARCVTCATAIQGAEVHVAVFAAHAMQVANQAAALSGVQRVLTVEDAANSEPLACVLAPQVAAISAGYTHVFGPSTTFGKDLMPHVAALLGVGQLSDIMVVEGAYRFRRPLFAGNAIALVEAASDRTLVATVRAASFPAAESGAPAPITPTLLSVELPVHTRVVGRSIAASSRPQLQSARRVVSGGRAMGSAENFGLILKLADRLRAAVGASRAAVDAGYAGNDLQVGQTGKIIAPDLYIAIGISGAIQHLTGIKDAGTIVAINKDPEAPIFEVADFGLVGDLFAVVPDLEKHLQ